MQQHMICSKQGNMEQGDLEVPITVQCAISSEKGQIMKRLRQPINKTLMGSLWFPRQWALYYITKKKVRQ